MPTAIEANIALRREAQEVIDLIGEKPAHFWRCLAEIAKDKFAPLPPAIPQHFNPKLHCATCCGTGADGQFAGHECRSCGGTGNKQPPPPAKGITVNISDPRYDKALELISEISELAGQMPDRGQDFAESAVETAGGIEETIEERGIVTPSQISALENIRDGLSRWFR